MRNAVVLMTALLPTTGHADLVAFAAALPGTRVWVLVNTRSIEPVPHAERLSALAERFAGVPDVVVVGAVDDDAPQQPGDHRDFWRWWTAAIDRACPAVGGAWDYVVASEPYGAELATALGATFVSYDLGRQLNPVTSSAARADPWRHWSAILPVSRRARMVTVTLFGPESVGKTTLASAVADSLAVGWLPEWARLHLAAVGPGVDEAVMGVIVAGQTAWQATARRRAAHPVLVQDTDLFSTLGYYQIMDLAPPDGLAAQAAGLASDLYLVLPDDIPFVPDPQRYGGHARESSTELWTRLLDEAGQPYQRVPSGSVADKTRWIADRARTLFDEKWREVGAFTRD